VVVEGWLVRSGELVAVQFDVGGVLDLFFGDGDLQAVGPDRNSSQGTKVRWRPIKPSLTVPNIGSLVSTST
jgi:hypothetical protein